MVCVTRPVIGSWLLLYGASDHTGKLHGRSVSLMIIDYIGQLHIARMPHAHSRAHTRSFMSTNTLKRMRECTRQIEFRVLKIGMFKLVKPLKTLSANPFRTQNSLLSGTYTYEDCLHRFVYFTLTYCSYSLLERFCCKLYVVYLFIVGG